MMKLISIVALTIVSFSAWADSNLQSFSIVREGGGSIRVKVTRSSADSSISAVTLLCNFKELTADQQQKTKVVLTGAMAQDAAAILDGQAVLAQEVRLHPMPTGTFLSLVVEMPGNGVLQTIQNPIILVNGQISDVLNSVESIGRQGCK